MTLHAIVADAVLPQPWRNGGGSTCALWAWPGGDAWRVRASVAEIDRDGPFSAYPGVRRWFAVVHGAGVMLDFPDRAHLQSPDSLPIEFDGAAAPGCRLVGGPTSDLNLMVRDGGGSMECVVSGARWWPDALPSTAQCGLYCRAAGVWQADDGAPIDVHAGTLLWSDDCPSGAWRFTSTAHGASPAGWWLRYCPTGVAP